MVCFLNAVGLLGLNMRKDTEHCKREQIRYTQLRKCYQTSIRHLVYINLLQQSPAFQR
jgi:hypothetical protein